MLDSDAYDAIVLAGGRGSRLGLVDKATLDVGDGPLLDGVLKAVDSARNVVVVGPPRDLPPSVHQIREDPVFGGPAAATVTGLRKLEGERAPWTLVLACDLPLAREAVPLLLAGRDRDGCVLADGRGRTQWVAGVYRTEPLVQAASALHDPTDKSMRALFGGIDVTAIEAPNRVCEDVDTWDQVASWNDYFIEGDPDD